jgi:uncharacterized protein (TIGR02001 family)
MTKRHGRQKTHVNILQGTLMKRSLLILALLTTASAAHAQDSKFGTFSGSVALTSDYVFRGFSQSDEHPAFQPALNWDSGAGWHVNLWASNVDFNDGSEADVEVDVTLGYAGTLDNLSYDFGAVYYAYPGARGGLNYDYWEGFTTLGYDTGTVKLNGSVFFSPDFFGGLDDAWAVQGGFGVPVAEGLTFDAQLGRQLLKTASGADYTYWNAGVTYSFPFADVGVRYHDTNVSVCGGQCGARAVLTLSKSF